MNMLEKSVKIIYENNEPVGCIYNNTKGIRFYKWEECQYGDIDKLFNATPVVSLASTSSINVK